MTEAEWDGTPTAGQMLQAVHRHARASRTLQRKYRLYTCHLLRQLAPYAADERFLAAIDTAEQHHVGGLGVSWADVAAAVRLAQSDMPVRITDEETPAEQAMSSLRHLIESQPFIGAFESIGPAVDVPFADEGVDIWSGAYAEAVAYRVRELGLLVRELFGNPFRPVAFDPRWRTSTSIGLADTMFRSGVFDRMPILADALQDAGCEDDAILGHCRDAGKHVRGCWVVDFVLGT